MTVTPRAIAIAVVIGRGRPPAPARAPRAVRRGRSPSALEAERRGRRLAGRAGPRSGSAAVGRRRRSIGVVHLDRVRRRLDADPRRRRLRDREHPGRADRAVRDARPATGRGVRRDGARCASVRASARSVRWPSGSSSGTRTSPRLPLPAAIHNAYQGFLPTYLYPFQFWVLQGDARDGTVAVRARPGDHARLARVHGDRRSATAPGRGGSRSRNGAGTRSPRPDGPGELAVA